MRRAFIVSLGAAVVLVALGVVSARLMLDGRQALAAAERAEAARDPRAAIRRYIEAGRLHVPFAGHCEAALDGLERMADAYGRRGDWEMSRLALEGARGVILGSRGLGTPHGERLPALEDRLARVLATLDGKAPPPGGDLVAFHRAALARRPGASTGFVALALLGFAMWIGAAMVFGARGLDAQGRVRARRAWLAAVGAAFVAGLVLFVIGLRFA